MNCVVFIGSQRAGSSFDALCEAKSMGYYVVLMTNIPSHMAAKNFFECVDEMLLCQTSNISHVRYEIDVLAEKGLKVCAVISFTEEGCLVASIMAKERGLVHFTVEAIRVMRDKLETRKTIGHTAYSPFFYGMDGRNEPSKQEIESKLPLIIKNPLSSGSKSVIMVNSYEDYKTELESHPPTEPLLIEEYLDGPQFLVETVVTKSINGSHVNIVVVIKQEISYTYRFIVTGYQVVLNRKSEMIESLIKAVRDIVKLIGLESGPCHLEMRFACGQWKLIEANPRISGGAMNRIIEAAYGISLVRETLKIALGQEPDLVSKYERETFAQYVIASREGILLRTTGKNKALDCEGVKHVYIKPKKGHLLVPPLSMGHRYAYVIANGDTAEGAMANAKYAAAQIRFFLKEIDADILKGLTATQRETLEKLYCASFA